MHHFGNHGGASSRGPQRSGDDRSLELSNEPRVFVLGGSGSTLGFINSFRTDAGAVTARLVPLAWTPIGVVIGESWQNVGIALANLLDWVDRTFPPEDERAFVAPMRDIELLARVQWQADLPEALSDEAVLNIEDLPEEIVDGLAHPPAPIVQCAACRRLCVQGEFVWKEKELCAWDYHAQVFGKRGPWHDGPYEDRHFETLPTCAYIAAPILAEMGVDVVFSSGEIAAATAQEMINLLITAEPGRPYMALRSGGGFSVLRER
ncbi:MAG TPA: hypothetical protein VMF11_11505 [Candidatus Baltobacteraceae bacterium]|nr:hypothetical protein [Candidatus Baltobacteraceae bacterium]